MSSTRFTNGTSLKYADYTVRESKKKKIFMNFFLQVECHIYLPQNELYDACKKLGLAVTAYAPFGSPGRYEQLYVLYKYFFLIFRHNLYDKDCILLQKYFYT